jgi:hypothetical protein
LPYYNLLYLSFKKYNQQHSNILYCFILFSSVFLFIFILIIFIIINIFINDFEKFY